MQMPDTIQFFFSSKGKDTTEKYEGTFTCKVLLTRREQFLADSIRRQILGPSSEGAIPGLQGEAFMASQLSVRILKSPLWWTNSDNGLELRDSNIIGELFEKSLAEIDKAKKEFVAQAEKDVEELR